ncbi:MAG: calcium/sodium antiporter [Lachnospiraceae bacterium]|nr:calcium/sodium antiporter [Lachnospiraceae bacterium]
MEIVLNIVLLVVGFAMLVKGADWFVDGAAGIAEKFGIPQLVVGLTIVAMGTSAPEAAVSITAALKGTADIAVGNVVGSNILNILIILGLTGFITNVAVQKSTLFCEIPYMLGITVVLLFMGMHGGSINLVEGIILWVLFIIYLAYLFVMAKKGKQSADESKESRPVWKLLIAAIVGGVVVVWGSNITVDSATALAEIIGLSEKFIGLTIVALGTSLPELVTSVTAAKKGNADIAIGNIVGACTINLLLVLGASSTITPLPFSSQGVSFITDGIIALGAAALLALLCYLPSHTIKRWGGALMLLGFVAYYVYLFIPILFA